MSSFNADFHDKYTEIMVKAYIYTYTVHEMLEGLITHYTKLHKNYFFSFVKTPRLI